MYFPELVQKKSEELQKFRLKYQCKHPSQQMTKRVLRKGVIQYVFQCLNCGDACSKAIKKEEALKIANGIMPNFNEELLNTKNNQYRDELNQIEEKYTLLQKKEIELRKNKDDAFFQKYSEYLLSNEWELKRQKVLKRANYICEACLEKEAIQVHHLTYKHVFKEPLFELVAICESCHELLHEETDTTKT